MILRQFVATFALILTASAQSQPGFQWMKQVDSSGMDSVAGLGTDSQGNIYLAGTTSSPRFPVKSAVQPNIASVGLYQFNGTSWAPLGLTSSSFLAPDPQNPSVIYAVSNGALMKSADSGVTFATTTLPNRHVTSIALEPGNDRTLLAGTLDQGVFKSVDGGATWKVASTGLAGGTGQIEVDQVWIDPSNVNVLLARTPSGLMRSADGAASWQPTPITDSSVFYLAFDARNPGAVYIDTTHQGLLKSSDHGVTFAAFFRPSDEVLPDPMQPGRLISFGGPQGTFQSLDGGATWTLKSTPQVTGLVADTVNGVYYGVSYSAAAPGIARISADLQTVTALAPTPLQANLGVLAVSNGKVYWGKTGSNVFVTKLDPSGQLLYSTYLGGMGADQAVALTVATDGNVFVTGTTTSTDFPVSVGAYGTSGSTFLFHLKPDGSLGYSTYLGRNSPVSVATDGKGIAWLLTNATLVGIVGRGGILTSLQVNLSRIAVSPSGLSVTTYVGDIADGFGGALALAADGTAYVGTAPTYVGTAAAILRVDSTASTLLARMANPPVSASAMAFGSDGRLYLAGLPRTFQPTSGAFQDVVSKRTGVARVDAGLGSVLAATYFGTSAVVRAMRVDAAGNVYIAGSNGSTGLPTRTPLAGGFAATTGFLSEFSADLSTLLFSSYFGNGESFTVSGVGIGPDGSVVIGGATGQNFSLVTQGDVWLNRLAMTPPPSVRIDSVVDAASLVDGPLSPGETIAINGAGFGTDSRVTIGGEAMSPISLTPTAITLTLPATLPATAAVVAVQSGGMDSNQVVMPVGN